MNIAGIKISISEPDSYLLGIGFSPAYKEIGIALIIVSIIIQW